MAKIRSAADGVPEPPPVVRESGEIPDPSKRLSGPLVVIFATACGLAVANLYYAQPLLATLASSFHVHQSTASIIVTVTQVGYAIGLILLVPLGDLFESRHLILLVMSGTVIALAAAALMTTLWEFLAAAVVIGITSVVAQILVPFAAHLAPPDERGHVVGQVMSGLLTGIVLARAVAGIVSGLAGWRVVYAMSAVLLAIMLLVLRRVLPIRRPTVEVGGYGPLIRSLGRIYVREPVLRRRAVYQAAMFGTFSTFWTGITFLLSGPPYRFSEISIGLFAFAGVLGVLIAPAAGRLGDKGHERWLTGGAFCVASASFALTLLQRHLLALIFGAIFIDLAVQTTLVLGQRAIYALNPNERSRLNTLYIATFFIGGAIGSAGAGVAYADAGWHGIVVLGAAFPLAALAFWLTERRAKAVPGKMGG